MNGPDLRARLDLGSNSVAADDILRYGIVNDGRIRLICGVGYKLERQDGGEWIAINDGMPFAAVGLCVEPGQTRQLKAHIPATAAPGPHGLATAVNADPGSGPRASLTLSALFDVR